MDFDETNDKLNKALTTLEEAEKNFKNAEDEVCMFLNYHSNYHNCDQFPHWTSGKICQISPKDEVNYFFSTQITLSTFMSVSPGLCMKF